MTSLDACPITVELSRKCIIFFGNVAGGPRYHSYYLAINNNKSHEFSLYSHLYIDGST